MASRRDVFVAGKRSGFLPDLVCIEPNDEGGVCAQPERLGITHFRGDEPQAMFEATCDSRRPEPVYAHRFRPGVQCEDGWHKVGWHLKSSVCPTCNGSGYVTAS